MKNILLFISFLLFSIGCIPVFSVEKQSNAVLSDFRSKNLPLRSNDILTNSIDTFIKQQINYYAPKSGSVKLVWKIENYPLEKSILLNDKAKLAKGLLYLPMIASGDTFKIDLKVPLGFTLYYNFCTVRNKQGDYQDFWDNQSSGNKVIRDSMPISKNAIYSIAKKKSGSSVLSIGWIILLFFIGVYILVKWIHDRWIGEIENVPIIQKMFFLGISLALFHALARANIIGVNPVNIIHNSRVPINIIRGSFSDLLFVAGLTITFMLSCKMISNIKNSRFVYWLFLILAFISTLIAYINITMVVFIGKPFTYQWLYYSDFLGSNEAKTALNRNLSIGIVINLLSFCFSMLLLSRILRIAYRLIVSRKYLKYIAYSFFVSVIVVFFLQSFKIKETWTKGQSENAITSMAYSMLTANSNSSFFSVKIPDQLASFHPRQSTKLSKPYVPIKNHKVKNVLIIILESAGASYFDGYGGRFNLSPNLNRYASQALMFDQMYAHAPATNLSLVSIIGSMYPYLSYKSLTQESPKVEYPTISSILKIKGYRTSFFSSADLRFQNCKQFLDHRGFDCIEDFATIHCSEQFQEANFKDLNGIDDLCLANRLSSWLDEDPKQSFFSVLWTVQGHYPYFFNKKEEDFGVDDFNFNRYLNCLKHDDELVGKVMKGLEDRGLASTTLTIVIGDHGEAFGQHNQYGHGTAIYEENLRVPFYIINPILFHGEHKGDIAEMKDLASTVLSFLAIAIPENWQGRDLLSTNSNETFYFAPWSDYLFGYRKDNMKYIFNESQNTVEVYDLIKDPKEKINLFQPAMKNEVAYARNRMATWVQYQDRFIKQIIGVKN